MIRGPWYVAFSEKRTFLTCQLPEWDEPLSFPSASRGIGDIHRIGLGRRGPQAPGPPGPVSGPRFPRVADGGMVPRRRKRELHHNLRQRTIPPCGGMVRTPGKAATPLAPLTLTVHPL